MSIASFALLEFLVLVGSSANNPEIHYLAVGNQEYASLLNAHKSAFEDFPGASLSVRRVGARLEDLGALYGLQLLSRNGRIVSAEDVRQALAEVISQAKKSRYPFLVVYITGHGEGESIAWHHFSVPGSAAEPIDFSSLERESQRLIPASSLVEVLDRSGIKYMLLLDSCYPSKLEDFKETVLSSVAEENLRSVAKILRYMNQFHQSNPVIFSTQPGRYVSSVPDPLNPSGASSVGPLARRLLCVTNSTDIYSCNREQKNRVLSKPTSINLAELVSNLKIRKIDRDTDPAITYAKGIDTNINFRWGRRSDLEIERRYGTAARITQPFVYIPSPVAEVAVTPGSRDSSVTINGVQDEYLSDGVTRTITGARYPAQAKLLSRGEGVEISFLDEDEFSYISISLRGERGKRLKAQGYRCPLESAHDRRPEIDISIGSRGCNKTTGEFDVRRLLIDKENVKRLEAWFVVSCDGGKAIKGKVSFFARK